MGLCIVDYAVSLSLARAVLPVNSNTHLSFLTIQKSWPIFKILH